MARADILSIMYSKEKSPLDFSFDSLWMPSMYNYITPQDIFELNKIATSNRYAAKIDLKYKAIDQIMTRRGFRKFHCGTNRIVYKYLEDERFLLKIALDEVGMGDNPKEYKNQFLLKPFVTKVFECSPCGTVAMVERVQPITSRQEFVSIGDSVYELLTNVIIGKYVLEDIGTKYFMNYGLRNGFGIVLLDYPYLYELDGNKLYCNLVDQQTGHKCDGIIDYDNGFNNLVCNKCGKLYLAQELETSIKDKLILMKEEGEIDMKITITRGNKEILKHDTSLESEVMVRKPRTMQAPRVKVTLNDKPMEEVKDEKPMVSFGRKSDNRNQKYNKNENRQNNNNKGREDNRKDKKPSNPNRFQNRKNNQTNSRLDKFEKFNKPVEQVKDENFGEKMIAKQEEEKLQEVRETIENTLVTEDNGLVSAEIAVEENPTMNNDSELLAAFGLSEKDFEEPTDNDDEDESIYDEY